MLHTIDLRTDEPRSAHAEAYTSQLAYNADALADLREAVECEPEVSDDYFLAHAEAADADNAAVRCRLGR